MPLSGIQAFQAVRIWIPNQKHFGNDCFGLLQEPLYISYYQLLSDALTMLVPYIIFKV